MTDIDLSVNEEEFGLPDAATVKQRKCDVCGKMVNVKSDGNLWKHECGPVVDIKLDSPEVDPKADWVEIIIDDVSGLPNFEVVSVNGHVSQIPRNIPIKVSPAIIEVLKNARAARSVAVPNPLTGHDELKKQHYNAIPWRKV